MQKPKAELIFDKTYAKGMAAVHRLEESLGVSFEARTIDKSYKMLSEDFKGMSLREVLTAGAEGATAKLLSTVWEAAQPKLVGRNLVEVMTGTTPSIRVPVSTPAKAYRVGETGAPPYTAEKYSYAEIVARLWECVPLVSRTLVEDAMWDVIARQYAEAGRAMAQAENDEIMLGLIADAGNSEAAASPNVLQLGDLVKGVTKLSSLDRDATDIVINPQEFGDLLTDTKITSWMNFGTPVIPTGKIPQILGCNLWMSSRQTAGVCTIVDRFHAAVLYVRRDVTIEDYEDPIQDLAGAVVTERFRYGKVDANAIYKVTAC